MRSQPGQPWPEPRLQPGPARSRRRGAPGAGAEEGALEGGGVTPMGPLISGPAPAQARTNEPTERARRREAVLVMVVRGSYTGTRGRGKIDGAGRPRRHGTCLACDRSPDPALLPPLRGPTSSEPSPGAPGRLMAERESPPGREGYRAVERPPRLVVRGVLEGAAACAVGMQRLETCVPSSRPPLVGPLAPDAPPHTPRGAARARSPPGAARCAPEPDAAAARGKLPRR